MAFSRLTRMFIFLLYCLMKLSSIMCKTITRYLDIQTLITKPQVPRSMRSVIELFFQKTSACSVL